MEKPSPEEIERIVKRIVEELKNRGVTELPAEDFDAIKSTESFNALLKSGAADVVILKNNEILS